MKRTAMIICLVCLLAAGCAKPCEHRFEERTVVEATCKDSGLKLAECVLCKYIEATSIPVSEHVFGGEKITKAATCTEEGELGVSCVFCGMTEFAAKIPKEPHSYISEVTVEATCVADGVETFTCSVCGDSYTAPIKDGSHKYETSVTLAATCIREGEKEYRCTLCGDSYREAVGKSSHRYTSRTVREVTCTEDGEKELTCRDCGRMKTEKLPATGHQWISANCTQAKHCGNCRLTEGKALGHDYQNGICTRCGNGCTVTMEKALPIRLDCSSGNASVTAEFSDMVYSTEKNRDGTVNLKITFTVCIVDGSGDGSGDFWVLLSGQDWRKCGFAGEKGKKTTASIEYKNVPIGDYTLVISGN